MSAVEILEQIRSLPETERQELVETIKEEYDEFDDALTPEQIDELERRATEARAHPERGIPWETLKAELFERYKVKA